MQVCHEWPQVRIDDHRIQSDYKYKSELQNPEGENSTLGIASCVVTPHDTNDNVTTKTLNTFNTAHKNTDTWVRSSLVC